MSPENIAQLIADVIEDDPGESVTAFVSSDPTEVWVEATGDDGVVREFRITVESQP